MGEVKYVLCPPAYLLHLKTLPLASSERLFLTILF